MFVRYEQGVGTEGGVLAAMRPSVLDKKIMTRHIQGHLFAKQDSLAK